MKLNRQIISYVVLSLALILFNSLYSLFSHGVSSDAMSTVWLFSLGCSFYYIILAGMLKVKKRTVSLRAPVNAINAGMASIIVGQLLKGIVEIAGTNSDYLMYYSLVGCLLISCGVLTCTWKIGSAKVR